MTILYILLLRYWSLMDWIDRVFKKMSYRQYHGR